MTQYDTLFLDRDGVINRQIIGGYVTCRDEFEFLPRALQALAVLAQKFRHIFIVTNQQGIGKGIFSMESLTEIHRCMLSEIEKAGGRIDRIYVSAHLESEHSEFRKPNTGMAAQAQREFADVDLARSVMVGDSPGDMLFGKRAGMKTCFITKGKPAPEEVRQMADEFYTDLWDFAKQVKISDRGFI